jgi:hypothetical protein
MDVISLIPAVYSGIQSNIHLHQNILNPRLESDLYLLALGGVMLFVWAISGFFLSEIVSEKLSVLGIKFNDDHYMTRTFFMGETFFFCFFYTTTVLAEYGGGQMYSGIIGLCTLLLMLYPLTQTVDNIYYLSFKKQMRVWLKVITCVAVFAIVTISMLYNATVFFIVWFVILQLFLALGRFNIRMNKQKWRYIYYGISVSLFGVIYFIAAYSADMMRFR